MSSDLTPHYAALDAFLSRARQALAPQRAELARWYTAQFRGRPRAASITHLHLWILEVCETPHPRLQFYWYPSTRSRERVFTPATPVPEFATEADAAAVGLTQGGVLMLRTCAFREMAADAWEDAGGFAFPQGLRIAAQAFERAGGPRPWLDLFREEVRKQAEGPQPTRHRLGPPVPLGLPKVPQKVLDAVRGGKANAITAWADAVERGGATEAAELFRWVPRFHAMIDEAVRAVAPQEGFNITVNGDGFSWWWIGDTGSESDNADAANLDRLLCAWNESHPAVEWLYRRLGLPHVSVEAVRHATDERVETRTFNLTAGEHLEPLADDVRVLGLNSPACEDAEE